MDANSPRPAARRGRAYLVWAISGLLLLAVGLVFGQTAGHDFIDVDDDGYVFANPHVTAGLTAASIVMTTNTTPWTSRYHAARRNFE